MASDGSGLRRVTANLTIDTDATWSPDGSRICIVSEGDGCPELYILRLHGEVLRRLTVNSASDAEPDWSPQGTRIAFSSNREGQYDIYTIGVDGTDTTRLTLDSSRDECPKWSPDGTKIAFVSDRQGARDVYVMDADGSHVTRITTHPAHDGLPSWSPDGQQIAFTSFRDRMPAIYVIGADGMGETLLSPAGVPAFSPSWSPDPAVQRLAMLPSDNLQARSDGAERDSSDPTLARQAGLEVKVSQIAVLEETDLIIGGQQYHTSIVAVSLSIRNTSPEAQDINISSGFRLLHPSPDYSHAEVKRMGGDCYSQSEACLSREGRIAPFPPARAAMRMAK